MLKFRTMIFSVIISIVLCSGKIFGSSDSICLFATTLIDLDQAFFLLLR